jgi:hypothetical protein
MRPFHVLTIDADYWFPYDQDRHCGFCASFRSAPKHPRCAGVYRMRTVPTHAHLFEMVQPGIPLRISESHATMFHILRKRVQGCVIDVVNVDEHADNDGNCDDPGGVHCGSWVTCAQQRGYLRNYIWIGNSKDWVRWRRTHSTYRPDLVHVCRSTPYMSTLGDWPFVDLVLGLERATGHRATVLGVDKRRLRRMLARQRTRSRTSVVG